jgi:hypothetical protein
MNLRKIGCKDMDWNYLVDGIQWHVQYEYLGSMKNGEIYDYYFLKDSVPDIIR